ncbi:ABC transporter substrate-binding protein [Bradyrhizobium arachidis]|uniref:ABC transporter substrate-binding protein n=1 Tax=Bradyrhizobium arachidis TaxID=858423 RepID=A0AAE7TGJ0_9BRAD|nr:ABC transporter substrate-binding protein [Bradyrhizobium arachidis]QOZ68272.1 ABC transporter substrate-binding protein [Bradyrhizobium arachidis]SFV18222.1 amino acid ABC transporter substrate-binding protein, PAAT family [Bradyrhizobium arachidis]
MIRLVIAGALGMIVAGPAFAVELPAEIAKRGSIKVAIVPNYPPMEFRDPATNALTGFDIDLGEALGRKLGVKLEWEETSFAQFMPSIASGRVDAILSGFTDYATRHEAATFVDYLRSGPQFFVQQSRAAEFKDMAALCGRKVGASRRTMFPDQIAAWSAAHCGSNPIVFVGTEGSADARTQLKQGRIDAAVQGNETLPYIMNQEPGVYAPLGQAIAAQFTGIALPVKEKALHQAFVEALDALIADGTYRALLAKWKLNDNGVEKATINAGQ